MISVPTVAGFAAGCVAAGATVFIGVSALTSVNADHQGPNAPGQAQYGDE